MVISHLVEHTQHLHYKYRKANFILAGKISVYWTIHTKPRIVFGRRATSSTVQGSEPYLNLKVTNHELSELFARSFLPG